MSESFTLGKKENLGDIDFSKVKNGLSKKDLGIEDGSVLSSIFDSIDTNQEGVSKGKLDKHELAAFIQTVKKLAKKDNILSEKEAGRFKINGEKVDKSGKELLDFLTRLAKTTDDIEEVISEENRQIVRYKNGSVYEEETFEDGSKFVRERYGTDTIETVFDAAGNEIRSTTIRDGKIIDDTSIEYDEDGYPVSKQVLNSGKCYNYTDTDYHSGRELEGNTYTVYRYDRESQTFIETESTSVYTDEDTNSAIKHYTNFETGDYERVEIINGLYRSHSKKSGDKIAELNFDKEGCLLGYIVQPGDTPESIAKKFGVSEELLLRANSSSSFLVLDKIRIPKQYDIDDPALQNMKTYEQVWEESPKVKQSWIDPNTGEKWEEELVIVRDKLKHDWKVAADKQGRYYVFTKDNEYLSDEEVAEQLYWDSLPKINCEFKDGTEVLGVVKTGLKSGRKLAQDRAGNMYIVSHDNKVLKEEYVAQKDLWDYSEKVQGRTNKSDGSWVVADYIVVKEGLPKGRKVVQDIDGNLHYMDSNGVICDEEVTKEVFFDKLRHDPEIIMKTTLTILTTMYENAKAAFDKQIREQGWTAKAADSLSALWGSKNRAEEVKFDLEQYYTSILTLKGYQERGEYENFKSFFKSMFKVDLRGAMLAEYVKNPSESNYVNTFGVDNDIAHRVAKYNDSQNLCGNIVKAVTSAVTGIIAALLIPVTGGASSIAVAAAGAGVASLLVGISDRASSEVGLREGDLKEIAQDAAWDSISTLVGGAAGKVSQIVIKGTSRAAALGRSAANVVADTAVGAAQEYAETGRVTIEGTASNMILSGAGNVAALKRHSSSHVSFSQMKPEDLLDEYNRLYKQTAAGNIDVKLKSRNIKQMKEIEALLKEHGFKIEHFHLKKLDTNPAVELASTPIQKVSKQELKAKLGNQLFEMHEMIESSIEKVKTINDYNRIKTIIISKFKDFQDVMNDLLTKLVIKAKQIGLEIQDSIEDIALGIHNLEAKIGKKLAKLYNKIVDAIDGMSSEKKYNKISKSITNHFAGYADIMDNLLSKLNSKAKQIGLKNQSMSTAFDNMQSVSPNVLNNAAHKYKAKILNCSENPQQFKKGDIFVADLASNKYTQLSLGPLVSVDLNEPRLAHLLKNLKEGESFTIGSFEGNATYKIGSSANGVSHQHLVVTKKDGVYIFKDTSTFGTTASRNIAVPVKRKDVKKMFPSGKIQGSYYINKVHNMDLDLDSTDYKNIAKLMNKCNSKYRKLWESVSPLDNGRNIDKLAAFAKLIRKHDSLDFYLNMDDRTWSVVVENICQKNNNAVNAIYSYKFNSSAINQALSTHTIYQPTGTYINNLTDYLNTQTINKRIKAYRGEQYDGSLSNIKFSNGMSAGEALERLIKKGASKQEIDKFVNKYLVGCAVKQERFMSTSLNRDFSAEWAQKNVTGHSGTNKNGAILWEIDIPGETKGAFVEDFNTPHVEEYEIILQRDSYLVIKGAHFDEDRNLWVIEAVVKQTPYEKIKRVSEG